MLLRVITAFLVVSLTGTAVHAGPKSARWRRYLDRRFATFDWNCTSTTWVDPHLRSKVARAIPVEDRGGPVSWGDRAIRVLLRSDRPVVFCIPTTCGATGNW